MITAKWIAAPVGAPASTLNLNEVHLWLADLDACGPRDTTTPEPILCPEELERASSMVNAKARRHFVAGRYFLRYCLSGYANCSPQALQFTIDSGGKPRIQDNPESLEFNLSHTRGLAIVAISRQAVGVDVEGPASVRYVDKIAERVFDECDIEKLRATDASDRAHTFVRLWTGYEARQKALGEGIFGRRVRANEVCTQHFAVDSEHLAAVASVPSDMTPILNYYLFQPTW